MFENGGKPRVGATWGMLGVRPPGTPAMPDIDLEPNGDVSLNNKGMSVFRSLADLPKLPARLVPIHLANKVRGAVGPSGTRIWAMGSAVFVSGSVTAALRLDAPGGHHGTVCPATAMPLVTFQQELANTRNSWDIDEP